MTAAIGFDDARYDELADARRVAERFGTDHFERTVTVEPLGIVEKLLDHFDEPFADSSAVPTYWVSQVARERVTVALSGDGGDELFGGYRRYRFEMLESRARAALPRWVRRGVLSPIAAAYPKLDRAPQPLRFKSTLTNVAADPLDAYVNSRSQIRDGLRARLLAPSLAAAVNGYRPADSLRGHWQRARDLDPLSRAQYLDIHSYLPDDLLVKVDRMSMAHALEVRSPFLDHPFFEFAFRLPARMKVQGGQGKVILRRSLEKRLPPETLAKPKWGFGVPLARWLKGELLAPSREALLGPGARNGEFLERRTLARVLDRFWAGDTNDEHLVWALLVLELWLRREAGPRGASA